MQVFGCGVSWTGTKVLLDVLEVIIVAPVGGRPSFNGDLIHILAVYAAKNHLYPLKQMRARTGQPQLGAPLQLNIHHLIRPRDHLKVGLTPETRLQAVKYAHQAPIRLTPAMRHYRSLILFYLN